MGGGGASSRSTSEDVVNGSSLQAPAYRYSGGKNIMSLMGCKLVRVLAASKGAPGTKEEFRCEQSIGMWGRCW